MVIDNDIVQINDVQVVSQQNVLNTFYYMIQVVTAGIILVDLLLEFRDQVTSAIRGIQNPNLEHVELNILNLTDGVNRDTLALGNFGSDSTGGTVSSSYVAAGWKLAVGSLLTRPGGKRFAGIGEARILGNEYDPDGGSASDVSAILDEDLLVFGAVAGEAIMVPVIVGRDVLGALDLTRVAPITQAVQQLTMRSQVSRRVPTT